MAILDGSKVWMYNFHYTFIMKRFIPSIVTCVSDTHCLLYHTKVNNAVDKLFKDRLELFDTSNYPRDHMYFSNERKNKLVNSWTNVSGRGCMYGSL